MKRLALILIPVLLCLFSCGRSEYGILSYQEKNIEAECTLNGEYKILVTKVEGKSSVSFIEPSSLSSISFVCENGEITARANDMEIPLNEQSLGGVSAILSMFSLSEECLAYAGESENGEVLEFSSNMGNYKLTMGEGEVPKRIEITSDTYFLDIVVDAMKVY